MLPEIETDPAPEYAKGFNEAYILKQHHPELSEKLAQSLEHSVSEYALGFKDGALQFEKEKEMQKGKEPEKEPDFEITWLQELPDDLEDRSPEMDKDDYDLEIE
jgi:hypothetical protein